MGVEMASGFDIYRAGYNRGVLCGLSDMRRLARWELLVRSPLTWLPFVDADSYVRGYLDGYWFGLNQRHI